MGRGWNARQLAVDLAVCVLIFAPLAGVAFWLLFWGAWFASLGSAGVVLDLASVSTCAFYPVLIGLTALLWGAAAAVLLLRGLEGRPRPYRLPAAAGVGLAAAHVASLGAPPPLALAAAVAVVAPLIGLARLPRPWGTGGALPPMWGLLGTGMGTIVLGALAGISCLGH